MSSINIPNICDGPTNKSINVKKIAIMQPYFFPYIGYFQLCHAVDEFVFLDDVNFINRGWINRNRIQNHGSEQFITVPLVKASQNKLIREISIFDADDWRGKILKTLRLAYGNAPGFSQFYPVVQEIVESEYRDISDLTATSVMLTCKYLNISPKFSKSSHLFIENLRGEDRIIEICKRKGASTYINPISGGHLYRPNNFKTSSLNLRCLQPKILKYKQPSTEFIPSLSIIDVIMSHEFENLDQLIAGYEVLKCGD